MRMNKKADTRMVLEVIMGIGGSLAIIYLIVFITTNDLG